MRAAIFEGPEKIRVGEWPTPTCNENEILLKTAYCAICGTDVRTFFYGHKKVQPPAIIGHEISGTVVDTGKNVRCVSKGDSITLVTSVGCGLCKSCQKGFYNLCPDTKAIGYHYPGGFAEYVVIPESAVKQDACILLPENVSLLQGALIEPLSCAINGQNYLGIKSGDIAVIFGGGPIGFMHAMLAQAQGAEQVIMIDPNFERLQRFSTKFQNLLLIDPRNTDPVKEVKKLTSDFGADVIITSCPAKEAQLQALEMAAPRARISLFGGLPKDDSIIAIDTNTIHYGEISLFGSFASNKNEYLQATDMISKRLINPDLFITEVIPLESIEKGIRKMRTGEVLKIVVELGE